MRELIVAGVGALCAAAVIIGKWWADERETPEERRLRGLGPMGDGWSPKFEPWHAEVMRRDRARRLRR